MRYREFAAIACAVVVASAVPTAAADATDSAAALSARPIAATDEWRANVVDDPDGLVYPVDVDIRGDASAVDDPGAMAAPDGRATTIRSTGNSGAPTPTLVLDLGLNTGGFVEVGITASDGTPFRLGYSEVRAFLKPTGDIMPRPGGLASTFGIDDDPDHRNDVFTPLPGTTVQTFRSPAVRGGQRWIHLQVEGAGTVSIDYVRVAVTHLRPTWGDDAGFFHSSDPVLNRVWFGSAYTHSMTTIRDVGRGTDFVYVDGAKRDRMVWGLDAVPSEVAGYYMWPSSVEIARRTINTMACQQEPSGLVPAASQISIVCPDGDPGPPDGRPPGSPPPDVMYTGDLLRFSAGSLGFVTALHQYWRYTGDGEFIVPMLPVARRLMKYFDDRLVGGLFPSQVGGPEITWHIDPAFGNDTYTNMRYYEALRDLADLERALGSRAKAAEFELDARDLRRAIRLRLWDPVKGAFLLNDVDPLRPHTSDVNMLAVATGIVTGRRAQRLLEFVATTHRTEYGTKLSDQGEGDPMVSQFNATYVMGPETWTRFARGDSDRAMEILRTGYAYMVDSDPGTLWERIGPDGRPWMIGPRSENGTATTNTYASLAHPMGTVIPAMSGWLLGIQPDEPGYATWRVAPVVADLASVQGQAPTPHGPIVSRWERAAGDRSFRLTVGAPAGTTGTVSVPLLGRPRVVAMDGRVIWDGSKAVNGAAAASDGKALHVAGVTGSHTFAWVA